MLSKLAHFFRALGKWYETFSPFLLYTTRKTSKEVSVSVMDQRYHAKTLGPLSIYSAGVQPPEPQNVPHMIAFPGWTYVARDSLTFVRRTQTLTQVVRSLVAG